MTTILSTPVSAPKSKIGSVRWTICGLLFFATTANYMDRQILSILAPTLQKEFGWSEMQYSNIITAFQAAYALSLLAFGRIIDLVGTRKGYMASVFFWCLAAMGHALVRSIAGFGIMRFLLGLAEAGNFPAAIKAVGEWFPRKERALATGIFNSGAMVGAVLAPLLIPWLALHWGWRGAFLTIAGFDVLWLFLWWLLYQPPERKKNVSAAELAYIQSDPPDLVVKKERWGVLLRNRATWAFMTGKFLSDPVWWFFLFWLPKFLNKQYGLTLAGLGLPLVTIYAASACGSIGGGWLAQYLLSRGWSVNASRKTVLLTCALCVVPVFLAASASSLWVAVGLISLATAAHCGWMANLFTLVSDLFPRHAAASVTGLGGMAGSVGAVLFAQVTGFLLQKTGTYWWLFAFGASAYLIAWVAICLLVPRIDPTQCGHRTV